MKWAFRCHAVGLVGKGVSRTVRRVRRGSTHGRWSYKSFNRSLNPNLTHFRCPFFPLSLTPSLTSLFIPLHRCLSSCAQFCSRRFGGNVDDWRNGIGSGLATVGAFGPPGICRSGRRRDVGIERMETGLIGMAFDWVVGSCLQ